VFHLASQKHNLPGNFAEAVILNENVDSLST
jgi:hypothetical protein